VPNPQPNSPPDPPSEPTAREAEASDIEQTLAGQLDELETLVREHPLATIGLAVGLGLLAGLMLRRS
jgi:ElaB/YqjD/DUF883 family membrane-anchored ribosome-binding protein